MEAIFDTLIDSFIEHKVGKADNFLNKALADQLRNNLLKLYTENNLLSGGTGNAATPLQDRSVRGDLLYWLDPNHPDIYEQEFFKLMDDFIRYLNRTCYTGITNYEFHYTLYEPGNFYKKHLDQFRNNDSRQFSMIMYLNENWKEQDGGEICIYNGEVIQKEAPENGKSIFFKSSELFHEVLPTNKPRMSITGWLKKS